jgi:nucleotide-binding universal stress UspA family protein
VETGDPATSIASLARDREIDLIMMPTRGHGAFRTTLLGAVASKVLHDSDCPVWTAAHVETLSSNRHFEWRNIVCAVSLSTEGARLLRTAQDLHETLGSTIHVILVVPGEEAFPQRLWNGEFESVLKQEAVEALRKIQCQAGTDFAVSIEAGDVSRTIADCARKQNADLVLAGRGLERGLARLRSHTYAIIRDAPCPVLNV